MPTGVYEHKSGYRTTKPRRTAIHVVGPSIAYLPLTKGHFAIIDAEDAEKCAKWSWRATSSPHDSTIYARASEWDYETKKVRSFTLHRFLLGLPDSSVDHKNCNGLHCWKGNLRLATARQNLYNSRKSSRNTSGYKGVNLHPQGWQARIMWEGKRIHLGFFDTPEEAGEAIRRRRESFHGEFTNHG